MNLVIAIHNCALISNEAEQIEPLLVDLCAAAHSGVITTSALHGTIVTILKAKGVTKPDAVMMADIIIDGVQEMINKK